MFLNIIKKSLKFRNYYCTHIQSHIPVMLNEVVQILEPKEKEIYVDMTFGAGGHTKEILKQSEHTKVICLDRDPDAYSIAVNLSKEYPNRVIPLLGKFSDLPQLLNDININNASIDGFLFDLGCSSMQFDLSHRGFSLSKNGPLDMRMDGNRAPENPTAADVIAHADYEELYKIIKVYGEEKNAKKIANAIVETRYSFKDIKTTYQLAHIVDSCFETDIRKDKLNRPSHNATKTFQALRIFVNNELNELNYGLILADKFLKIGGKLITLSFHSLEDLIIKRHITGHLDGNNPQILPLKYCNFNFIEDEYHNDPKWISLFKHVQVPSKEEINNNPRSRSAKLRAAIKS